MLQPGDRKAALTGLILGVIALFSIIVTIVQFTNQHFARTAAHGVEAPHP